MIRIIQGDFNDRRVVDLLHIHLTSARAQTARHRVAPIPYGQNIHAARL
jgi:hypothetical protein